jgi:predicted ATPase
MVNIVGAQGSGVNKLRDALGVQVDFSDEADEKEKEAGKKKKANVHQKFKTKVVAHLTCLSSPYFSLYL